MLHAVAAGEQQPLVGGEFPEDFRRGLSVQVGLHLDQGNFQNVRAEGLQTAGKAAGTLEIAGQDNAPARQWTGLDQESPSFIKDWINAGSSQSRSAGRANSR